MIGWLILYSRVCQLEDRLARLDPPPPPPPPPPADGLDARDKWIAELGEIFTDREHH